MPIHELITCCTPYHPQQTSATPHRAPELISVQCIGINTLLFRLKGEIHIHNKTLHRDWLSACLFVYVIAWARGQLRINFTRIFKVLTKLPESRSDEGNLENFENTSDTCLSHKGQNSVNRTTFKVLPSRKQVCRSSKRTS